MKKPNCDNCDFAGNCSAEQWVRKRKVIPDNCPYDRSSKTDEKTVKPFNKDELFQK